MNKQTENICFRCICWAGRFYGNCSCYFPLPFSASQSASQPLSSISIPPLGSFMRGAKDYKYIRFHNNVCHNIIPQPKRNERRKKKPTRTRAAALRPAEVTDGKNGSTGWNIKIFYNGSVKIAYSMVNHKQQQQQQKKPRKESEKI